MAAWHTWALIGADAVSAFPHLPVLSFLKSEADPSHAFAHCSQICPCLTSFTLYESARGTNATPTKPILRSSRGELVMSSPEHGTWDSQRLVGRRSISRSFISGLWRAVEGKHRGSMSRRYVRSFHFFFQNTSIQNVYFEELTIIVCEYASIITNKLIS